MEELWGAGEAPADGPRFRVVWRGYDRVQVDEYVRALDSAGTAPAAREAGSIDDQLAQFFAGAQTPEFDAVLRGYDRHEVQSYLAQFQ